MDNIISIADYKTKRRDKYRDNVYRGILDKMDREAIVKELAVHAGMVSIAGGYNTHLLKEGITLFEAVRDRSDMVDFKERCAKHINNLDNMLRKLEKK